jgi:hypothetical protein
VRRFSGQYSLFGAAAAPPALDDLDGVLLAGGHWSRSAEAARLSVVVADRWRADALAAEFAVRDLDDEDGSGAAATPGGGWSARTARSSVLLQPAARWIRGAAEVPPSGLDLTPGALRLWAIAAGRHDEAGYLLGTAAPDRPLHLAAGAQLSRLGLAAVSVPGRGGPGWRVPSTRRIRRLAELLGEPPPGCGPHWPSAN